MSVISPRVERAIATSLDFRLLVYLYLYQYPEATKASLAARLGIAPITMSRAIAAGKKGVDKSLVPAVLELLKELDYNRLFNDNNRIRFLCMEQGRYEREGKLREILCKKINVSADSWQYSSVPTNFDYVLIQENGKKQYFNEITGSSGDVRRLLPRAMGCISQIPGNDEVTLVCYSQEVLEALMGQYTAQTIRRAATTHPITVMLIDLDHMEVSAEYILYEPGKLFYSFYEAEENDGFEDSQDF